MRHRLLVAASLSVLACAAAPATAQPRTATVFDGAPAAPWISHPEAPGDEFGVFHFRRSRTVVITRSEGAPSE